MNNVLKDSGLTSDKISKFETNLQSKQSYQFARNLSTFGDPMEAGLDWKTVNRALHVFQHTIPTNGKPNGKPATNLRLEAKDSDNSWITLGLKVMSLSFMKNFELDEFEFSQAYLIFWDKLERCYYLLHSFVEMAMENKTVDEQLPQFLLTNPVDNRGQWDMLVNLIIKYGVMPKTSFPGPISRESFLRMNDTLQRMMRENYSELMRSVAQESQEKLKTTIDSMIEEVYQVVSVCLGTPPQTVNWEYRDSKGKFHKMAPVTPKKFYEDHVKPLYDIEDKVCLVNDPRPQNPYERMYAVDFLGNMVGGRKTLYNNQRIEVLKKAAACSIEAGEPVWFGCDVGRDYYGKLGINDKNLYDYKLLFGISVKDMTKAERLVHKDSFMTHAMVLTGFTAKPGNDGSIENWKVDTLQKGFSHDNGYLVMTDDWFSEFVYEVVVDKSYLSDDVLEVLEQDAIQLHAWDSMGSLF